MPRLTPDQWATIRIEWEGDPSTTHMGLGEKHGVHFSSISRRAKAEGWERSATLAEINEAAHRAADGRTDADGNARQTQSASAAKRGESEGLRAEVLARHRAEWAELTGFRKAALASMKTAHEKKDREGWQIAKLAADTARANLAALETSQAGEARAWGLDYRPADGGSDKNMDDMSYTELAEALVREAAKAR